MTTCDYCNAVGACPKCWGRAAINELKMESQGKYLEYSRLMRELLGHCHLAIDTQVGVPAIILMDELQKSMKNMEKLFDDIQKLRSL